MLTRISSGILSRETIFLVLDIWECVAMIKDQELGCDDYQIGLDSLRSGLDGSGIGYAVQANFWRLVWS